MIKVLSVVGLFCGVFFISTTLMVNPVLLLGTTVIGFSAGLMISN